MGPHCAAASGQPRQRHLYAVDAGGEAVSWRVSMVQTLFFLPSSQFIARKILPIAACEAALHLGTSLRPCRWWLLQLSDQAARTNFRSAAVACVLKWGASALPMISRGTST